MSDAPPLRIGVLGAARITPQALIKPAASVAGVQIAALAARDPSRAQRFAQKHGIPTVHQTYEALLSDPQIDPGLVEDLLQLPLLEPAGDFWLRAGLLRATVLGRRRKARLADALIAQLCIDHDVQLVTRDRDFHAFAETARLSLVAR